MIVIRKELETDYETVEALIRRAFYNLYIPGCVEHYLARRMRNHEDFIRELDFVMELEGEIIGNIMYTKSRLTDENGREKEIVTFGPVCIDPEHQRKGYGKKLIGYSLEQAKALGYEAVVIFGSPVNYVGSGFVSCRKYSICGEGGKYPAAMLVRELAPGALSGHRWLYQDSPVMAVDEQEARKYDDRLEKMERKHLPSQEEFYIMSRSFLE